MISKFRTHAHGGLVTYNLLASQRPDVILAENLLRTPEATTIWTAFATTSIQATKIEPKDRKRIDCIGRSREPIAPGNAISLRVQPFYESNDVNSKTENRPQRSKTHRL